ncbi:hypothetical protein EIN_095020 [Entamoeba invadens IP1]|uniref:Uncharacterized protein n=1 Tax=Entamoeba invadens IP1 TaxID=370355 RepID=A0A0A1U046_ENTIV|nr:hypothetical protein EIN_095020 [Entamoeba invadens IP1]ELP87265.1 hypothetical protein EIN_095020 [Entamoeba invadens IP1]|eukprot:XP_004254036.1 hypothetical protein EIN_095020 [Entamoeba invadens IP1]
MSCMRSTKEVMRSERRERYSYGSLRNHQACVEAVMLSFLNQFAEITIKQPLGKSSVALSFIPIKTIAFSETDIIDVEKFIEQRLEEIMVNDQLKGIPKETAKQRKKTNRLIVTVDYLSDLVAEKGAIYNMTRSNGKNETMVVETYWGIKFGDIFFNKKQIDSKGRKINRKLLSLVGTKVQSFCLCVDSENFYI